jgi:hypothetical protein
MGRIFANLPINIQPHNNGFLGGGKQFVSSIQNTIGTVMLLGLFACLAGFILGAAMYAFSARSGHTRAHESTRLIFGSLIGALLFGGAYAILSVFYNAGGAF